MWGWFRDRAASWSCETLLFLLFGSDWSTQLTLGLYIVRSRHYNNPACVSHRRLQQHLGSTGPQSRTIRGCEELCEAAGLTSEHHNKQSEEAICSYHLHHFHAHQSITNTYYVTMAIAVTMTPTLWTVGRSSPRHEGNMQLQLSRKVEASCGEVMAEDITPWSGGGVWGYDYALIIPLNAL